MFTYKSDCFSYQVFCSFSFSRYQMPFSSLCTLVWVYTHTHRQPPPSKCINKIELKWNTVHIQEQGGCDHAICRSCSFPALTSPSPIVSWPTDRGWGFRRRIEPTVNEPEATSSGNNYSTSLFSAVPICFQYLPLASQRTRGCSFPWKPEGKGCLEAVCTGQSARAHSRMEKGRSRSGETSRRYTTWKEKQKRWGKLLRKLLKGRQTVQPSFLFFLLRMQIQCLEEQVSYFDHGRWKTHLKNGESGRQRKPGSKAVPNKLAQKVIVIPN